MLANQSAKCGQLHCQYLCVQTGILSEKLPYTLSEEFLSCPSWPFYYVGKFCLHSEKSSLCRTCPTGVRFRGGIVFLKLENFMLWIGKMLSVEKFLSENSVTQQLWSRDTGNRNVAVSIQKQLCLVSFLHTSGFKVFFTGKKICKLIDWNIRKRLWSL